MGGVRRGWGVRVSGGCAVDGYMVWVRRGFGCALEVCGEGVGVRMGVTGVSLSVGVDVDDTLTPPPTPDLFTPLHPLPPSQRGPPLPRPALDGRGPLWQLRGDGQVRA